MTRSFLSLLVIGLALVAVAIPAAAPATTSTELTATVIDVTDGDTVDVEYQNGSTDTVRLLGVDTPEVHVENDPTKFEGVPDTEAGEQCLDAAGENASQYAKSRLEQGEEITLALDEESDTRGDYGRLLAYIHDDGQNLNYDLIDTGHARVYDSEFSQSDRFYAAESDAQAAERGLWHCRETSEGSGLSITEIHADAEGDDREKLSSSISIGRGQIIGL